MSNLRIGLLLALALPSIVGCASIDPMQMVPDATTSGARHNASVALDVGGGSGGAGWYSGTFKPKALRTALAAALQRSDLFWQLIDDGPGDYELRAAMSHAGSHPGFGVTAWVHIDWALLDTGSGSVVWAREIKSDGKASWGEAFNARTRQYIALERAAKTNIGVALNSIGGLDLGRTAEPPMKSVDRGALDSTDVK